MEGSVSVEKEEGKFAREPQTDVEQVGSDPNKWWQWVVEAEADSV